MNLFGSPDVSKLTATKDVKGLIKALGYQKDHSVQEKAANALGLIGDVRAVEPLIAVLKETRSDFQKEAANALAKIGDTRAVDPLIVVLKDPDRYVRIAAADALGRMRDKRAVIPLINVLRDPEAIVRKAVANDLGLIGDTSAVDALIPLLKDEWDFVRLAAVNALDQLGWKPDLGETSAWYWVIKKNWEKAADLGSLTVKPLLFALKSKYPQYTDFDKYSDYHEWNDTAKTLVKIGKQAVDPLIAALNDVSLRGYAIAGLKVLGKSQDPQVVQSLMSNLKDEVKKQPDIYTEEDEKWCTVVVKELGKTSDPRTVELFIPLLRKGKNDWILFNTARDALILVGDPAVEPLITVFNKNDERADVRKGAAEALGRIGDPRAVMPLIDALKDKNDDIRYYAVTALGNLGDPRAVEPLRSVLKDKAEHVRKVANAALEKFNNSQAKDALTPIKEKKVADTSEGFHMDGQLASYTLSQTCLGNPLNLKVKTDKFCIYCAQLRDPNLRASGYSKGIGECDYGVHSLDDTCEHWRPNNKVRFWLSKGYMENNLDGWPRKPWYHVFEDGPDGEKGTRG